MELKLENGRPADTTGRLEKEIRTYDFLDALQVPYQRIDHETLMTIEACKDVDKVLDAAGRKHSAADVERAYAQARRVGFKYINMDLIAGLPSDDAAGFKYSLDRVLALKPEKLCLAISSGEVRPHLSTGICLRAWVGMLRN